MLFDLSVILILLWSLLFIEQCVLNLSIAQTFLLKLKVGHAVKQYSRL